MKKNLIKILFILFLSLCCNATLLAASATVTYVSGKVEVKRNNAWIGLNVGDTVFESETISTGFQSEAKLKYNGSLLSLSALTRVTLEELSSTKSGDSVNVYLNTGAVRSKVTHTGNERVSYTVHSPVAVASVRGTDYVMMANGRVRTFEGAVVVYPARFYVPKIPVSHESAEIVVEETEVEVESSVTEVSEDVADAGSEHNADALVENNSAEIAGMENSTEYVPATATTNASDISSNVPAGAVVVGRNQTTEISTTGIFKSPLTMANSEIQKAKSTVTTAAEKDAASNTSALVGVTAGTTSGSLSAAKKTGSVTVKVFIEK